MKKQIGIFLLVAGVLLWGAWHSDQAAAQAPYAERSGSYSTGSSRSGAPGAYCQYCKTREEIAWDLMMYGLQTLPTFKGRIKDYDDLLSAYRLALRTVREQDK